MHTGRRAVRKRPLVESGRHHVPLPCFTLPGWCGAADVNRAYFLVEQCKLCRVEPFLRRTERHLYPNRNLPLHHVHVSLPGSSSQVLFLETFCSKAANRFFVCFLEGGFAFPFVHSPSGFTLSRVDGTDFTYRPRPIRNLDIEPVAYFYASLLISLLFGRVHSLAFLQYFDFFPSVDRGSILSYIDRDPSAPAEARARARLHPHANTIRACLTLRSCLTLCCLPFSHCLPHMLTCSHASSHSAFFVRKSSCTYTFAFLCCQCLGLWV